jgi:hypothetical protein
MCVTNLLHLFFDNKRYTMILLVAWMCLSCTIFYQLGAFHMHFMTFGPSDKTVFMGMVIDTWNKWYCLAGFSFLNTSTNEFLSNALMPWFQNTIQDHKSKYLPYSQSTCMTIILLYDLYTHVMSIFGIYLLFSQIDFLIIQCIADMIITVLTTKWFMQHKTTDREQYLAEVQHVEVSELQQLEKVNLLPVVDADDP